MPGEKVCFTPQRRVRRGWWGKGQVVPKKKAWPNSQGLGRVDSVLRGGEQKQTRGGLGGGGGGSEEKIGEVVQRSACWRGRRMRAKIGEKIWEGWIDSASWRNYTRPEKKHGKLQGGWGERGSRRWGWFVQWLPQAPGTSMENPASEKSTQKGREGRAVPRNHEDGDGPG